MPLEAKLAIALSEPVVEADGKLVDSSDARDEAALESTLENSEANELETAESVAVAATLESSELSEEARLESASEAAAVTDDGTLDVSLAMLEASESTEDCADETTLEASDATEDTRPERLSKVVEADDEAVDPVPVRIVSEAAVFVCEPDAAPCTELVTETSLPVKEPVTADSVEAVRGRTKVPEVPVTVV